jgi:hypothetical protein
MYILSVYFDAELGINQAKGIFTSSTEILKVNLKVAYRTDGENFIN